MSQPKIVVGLSGGVDSAVTLALLNEQGIKPQAIYMRNWSRDLPGFKCPWREDWHDAQSVALSLNIPIEMWDFEKDYKDKVVDYLVKEYRVGRTPNPDIICNQEVKFKVFLEHALELGADKIATGHYAQIYTDKKGRKWLQAAKDKSKDQSYFLARIDQHALSHSIFPLGDHLKSEVRQLASTFELPVATKKDSVGICFVGEVGIVDFLKNFIKLRPGPIIDVQSGKELGQHEGAQIYTIGQRHGLNLSNGEMPYYVIKKNIKTNTVYVSNDISAKEAWASTIILTDCHLPTALAEEVDKFKDLSIRIRHLGKLEQIQSLKNLNEGQWQVKLKEPIKTPAPGQTGVVYTQNELVLLTGFID